MRSTFVSYDDGFAKLTSAMSNLLVGSFLKPCGGNVLMDRSKIIYLSSESIAFVIPDFQYLYEAFSCRRSFIKERILFCINLPSRNPIVVSPRHPMLSGFAGRFDFQECVRYTIKIPSPPEGIQLTTIRKVPIFYALHMCSIQFLIISP